MERESAALKTRVATADGVIVQFRERNSSLYMAVGNFNTTLAKRRTDVECANVALTTVRKELTSVRAQVPRSTNIYTGVPSVGDGFGAAH